MARQWGARNGTRVTRARCAHYDYIIFFAVLLLATRIYYLRQCSIFNLLMFPQLFYLLAECFFVKFYTKILFNFLKFNLPEIKFNIKCMIINVI